MRKSIFWILLLAALPVVAQTNPPSYCCRYPMRGFGNANVNLTPLFTWWSRQEASLTNKSGNFSFLSPRPMPAWKRIVGTKVGDSQYGWFADVEIFTNTSHGFKTRIVLQNPPIQDEQQLNALQQQITGYNQQIANSQEQYKADVKEEKRAEKQAKAGSRSWHLNEALNAKNDARLSAQKRDDAQKDQATEAQTKGSLQVAEQQLAAIPTEHGRYQIDLFALETGKSLNGLPMYDLGVISYGR